MQLIDILDKRVSIAIVIMLGLTLFNTYLVQSINVKVTDFTQSYFMEARLEYPMGVIEYGLQDDLTDEAVKRQIDIWIQQEWGAQIVALQVVCRNDVNRLHQIMSEDLTLEVCRSV